MMKTCPKCKEEKPLKEYYKNKRESNGHSCYCKKCTIIIFALWRKNNSEKYKQYLKIRKQERKHVNNYMLYRAVHRRVHSTLRNYKKFYTVKELLGCSSVFYEKYIESKFQKGMNWKNFGVNGWCIDHKIPLSAFDLSDKNQQLICFNFRNTQPLWYKDNLKKGKDLFYKIGA